MPKYTDLVDVFAAIHDPKDMRRLLNELLTANELEDVWRRWQIMRDLSRGLAQRDIAERHNMSLCKVTRGSKIMQDKHSICRQIIEERK
ncbi:MAG: Trp family transcriptional regulator [Candidatus Omnitrophota bacterium]